VILGGFYHYMVAAIIFSHWLGLPARTVSPAIAKDNCTPKRCKVTPMDSAGYFVADLSYFL
jgi:hypothetical protein